MTILVITGAPGIGKTTAVIHVARTLRDKGINVGGIVSRELRTNNMRIGFEFIDLITNDTNVLASITGNGPQIGKYFVSLEGCRFAAERLNRAIKRCDVVICEFVSELVSFSFTYLMKLSVIITDTIHCIKKLLFHYCLIDNLKSSKLVPI
jgi:nucleoside-triphosphatase